MNSFYELFLLSYYSAVSCKLINYKICIWLQIENEHMKNMATLQNNNITYV